MQWFPSVCVYWTSFYLAMHIMYVASVMLSQFLSFLLFTGGGGNIPECLAAHLYKQVQAFSSSFWPHMSRLITGKEHFLKLGTPHPMGKSTFWHYWGRVLFATGDPPPHTHTLWTIDSARGMQSIFELPSCYDYFYRTKEGGACPSPSPGSVTASTLMLHRIQCNITCNHHTSMTIWIVFLVVISTLTWFSDGGKRSKTAVTDMSWIQGSYTQNRIISICAKKNEKRELIDLLHLGTTQGCLVQVQIWGGGLKSTPDHQIAFSHASCTMSGKSVRTPYKIARSANASMEYWR